LGLGIFGITLMKSSGFMVDDIPESDPVYKDLKFFEANFEGLMPLEIMIDTKKPGGVMQLSTFSKIDQLEKELTKYPEFSTPLSLLNLLKFSKQAFYNGNENYYSIPNNRELKFHFAICRHWRQRDRHAAFLSRQRPSDNPYQHQDEGCRNQSVWRNYTQP
jgi:uncharacterized protein